MQPKLTLLDNPLLGENHDNFIACYYSLWAADCINGVSLEIRGILEEHPDLKNPREL